ncbi:hypothetical protein [Trichloromonas sp.]|uniref:hypothetical protein n=1 Tax=Trichloromonas sp. TaxID=3069249 RepID=UPI002A38E7BC|nr:hypothetical protein [Trichloromonas sp.]
MKNLAGKFLYSTSGDTKKSVELFINKLNNSKDIDNMEKIFLNYLKNNNQTLKELLKETDNIEDIKNIFKDNLSFIYISLKSFISFINKKEYNISNVFKDSNNSNIKRLFVDDEKVFNKNINGFVDLFILDLSKSLNLNTNKGQKDEELDNIISNVDKDLLNDINDIKTIEIEEDLIKLKSNILNWFNINIINKIINNLKL